MSGEKKFAGKVEDEFIFSITAMSLAESYRMLQYQSVIIQNVTDETFDFLRLLEVFIIWNYLKWKIVNVNTFYINGYVYVVSLNGV